MHHSFSRDICPARNTLIFPRRRVFFLSQTVIFSPPPELSCWGDKFVTCLSAGVNTWLRGWGLADLLWGASSELTKFAGSADFTRPKLCPDKTFATTLYNIVNVHCLLMRCTMVCKLVGSTGVICRVRLAKW